MFFQGTTTGPLTMTGTMMQIARSGAVALLVALFVFAAPVRAEPDKSKTKTKTKAKTPAAVASYSKLLAKVVKNDGVDYPDLRKRRQALDAYVSWLAKADPGKTRAHQIAFWINAYNACTLQQVLDTKKPGQDKYSVMSVKGFWKKRKWTVAGRSINLDSMEKDRLLKAFREPRVHFAVNCASESCPALINQLYQADTLDVVLTQQTRAYLANTGENEFNRKRRRAKLSEIFSWYRGDFAKDGKLEPFLAKYAPSETLARLLRKEPWRIRFQRYSWALNQAGRKSTKKGSSSGWWRIVWLVPYLLATLGLLLYGLHAFKMLRWRTRHGPDYDRDIDAARAASPFGRTEFPRVLVQLPVYNEPGVVERAIDAAAALDYPREQLEIQVLDDSTDETVSLVDRAVARWRDRGVPVSVLRRPHRDGFKAGALAEGLKVSDADYVAIFDADFVPHPGFLLRALPLFHMKGRVAIVQGRWEHLNRDQNRLTRAQAVGVDAHFRVEQYARAARGAFLNFNGTAGVWSRAAIEDAGGWRGDTLTEDLDLSYRAQLRGWRIVFDPELEVPAELPPTLGAYKSQQRRWACGSIQCARKFLGAIWRSDLPLWKKGEATVHLCGYGVCVAMLALILLLPFGVGHVPFILKYPHLSPLWIAIWIAALGPISISFASQRPRGLRSAGAVLSCFLLGLGSCANNAFAVFRGLTHPIRTFVRTPKQGLLPGVGKTPAPVLELAFSMFTVTAVVLLLETSAAATAAYALFCCAGFLFISGYWWLAERHRAVA